MGRLITATRASTLAKALDDSSGLMDYYAATTLQAVVASPTLLTRLGTIEWDGVLDWRPFKPLVQDAQAQRGKPEAEAGTNIHAVVEALHHERPVLVPDDVMADARAVLGALRALGRRPIAAEEFVYTAGLPEPVAGTRDMLVARDGAMAQVVDIKSTSTLGSARYRAVSWAIQLAVYANGVPYPTEGLTRDQWGRPRIDPDLLAGGNAVPVDTETALVVEVERGTARVEVHQVDLVAGWHLAGLACQVRRARKPAQSPILNTFTYLE